MENHKDTPLEDITHTASLGRTPFAHRMAIIGTKTSEVREKLRGFVTNSKDKAVLVGRSRGTTQPKIAFLFTGQGSQYVHMVRQLYQTQPVFREALDRCNELLRPYLQHSLLSVLYPPNDQETPINETAYTQPVLFSIEYALT